MPTTRPLLPRHPTAARLALAAYCVGVAALSHLSDPPLSPRSLGVSDKVAHAVEYAPLGFLWAASLGGPPLRGIAAGTLFGVTDELHQAFVPGRDASALDVAADAAGCAAGVLLPLAASRLVSRIRRKSTGPA